jgi:hypothetical protein
MKKKGLIIASLLVLVMSVVFLGCPPPEDEVKNDPTVPADVLAKLTAFGYSGTSLPVPEGGNYDTYYDNMVATTEEDGDSYHAAVFAVLWDKCTEDMIAEYKKLWGTDVQASIQIARAAPTQKDGFRLKASIGGTGEKAFRTGQVFFTDDGGELYGKKIKENSIVFLAFKPWVED